MQENDFEKQVKNEMEHFSLMPTEPVWGKIERQIPGQNRRRRFIAFIFLFAGIMVCSYFYYDKWNNAGQNLNLYPNDTSTATAENNTMKIFNHKENSTGLTATPSLEKPGITAEEKITDNNKDNVQKNITAAVAKPEKNNLPSSKDKLNDSRIEVANLVGVTNADKISTDIQLESKTGLSDKNVDVEENKLKPAGLSASITESEMALNIKQADTTSTVLIKESTQLNVKSKKQTINAGTAGKWQFGITGFYGSSDVTESFLGLSTDKSAGYDNTASPVTGSGNLGQYQFNVSKQVKAKQAFTVGLALKKRITAKSSFITGIQYSQFNTQIETGMRKDSSATFEYNNSSNAPVTRLDNFYTTGSGNNYTNTYHLVQIPVIYEHRVGSSKKISINWNAGLTLGQLIKEKALVFDYGNQAFYNNSELFKQTQITMLAGLNLQFALNKKTSINLGPQLEYSLSNLLRSKSYGKQHFINYGLKANIFFKK